MNVYPRTSLLIYKTTNGYIAEVAGSREMQEDKIPAGFYVFESLSGLTSWITKYFVDMEDKK